MLESGRVAVGRADQTKVRPTRRRFAQSLVLAAAVEHAKQMRLLLDGQIADFVEKQRSAVSLTDETRPFGLTSVRIVSRAPKELRIDKAGRQRGGVARYKGSRRVARQGVDGTRGELFSRPALADEKRMRHRFRNECELFAKMPRGWRLAEDSVSIGLTELAPGARSEIPTFRHQRDSPRTEQQDLAAQVDRVAGTNDRSVAPNSVHPKVASAHALDGHTVVMRCEHELASRQPAPASAGPYSSAPGRWRQKCVRTSSVSPSPRPRTCGLPAGRSTAISPTGTVPPPTRREPARWQDRCRRTAGREPRSKRGQWCYQASDAAVCAKGHPVEGYRSIAGRRTSTSPIIN